MNQKPNQKVEYVSVFLNENEVVNESDFDEQTGEQEAGKLVDNQQKKTGWRRTTKKGKTPKEND